MLRNIFLGSCVTPSVRLFWLWSSGLHRNPHYKATVPQWVTQVCYHRGIAGCHGPARASSLRTLPFPPTDPAPSGCLRRLRSRQAPSIQAHRWGLVLTGTLWGCLGFAHSSVHACSSSSSTHSHLQHSLTVMQGAEQAAGLNNRPLGVCRLVHCSWRSMLLLCCAVQWQQLPPTATGCTTHWSIACCLWTWLLLTSSYMC